MILKSYTKSSWQHDTSAIILQQKKDQELETLTTVNPIEK
jgi:hypothetical protein